MKNLAVIQARMGSSRLPNKVLKDLCGKPALWHVIHRVKKSKLIDEIVIATTIEKQDLKIVKFCADNGIRVFIGSEADVLDRYYQAARLFKPDNVVRITSDCPLHDSDIIDSVIEKHIKENNDYTSNTIQPTFPDGLDCEVMKYSALEKAWENAAMTSEREHVTQYLIKNDIFKKGCLLNSVNKESERWTLDTDADYEFIRSVYSELYYKNPEFSSADIYGLLEEKPEIRKINQGIIRNEGLLKSLNEDKKFEA